MTKGTKKKRTHFRFSALCITLVKSQWLVGQGVESQGEGLATSSLRGVVWLHRVDGGDLIKVSKERLVQEFELALLL